MIGYLKGKIKRISGENVILVCGGVGYEVFWAGGEVHEGDEIEIWVYTHYTEKSVALYGFCDEKSKRVFLSLLKVNGVGPKSAFQVIVHIGAQEAMAAISQGDATKIATTPGVGQKIAKRIVREVETGIEVEIQEVPEGAKEVEAALKDLGYDRNKIAEVVAKICKKHPKISTEELIKKSIKEMSK